MADDQTGVLIFKIHPASPADGVLETGDVLMAIDGLLVADDGTVEFRPKERTSADHVIDLHQIGDTAALLVFRRGLAETVTLTLHRNFDRDQLIPAERYDTLPTYYVYGGLVFCPLTKNLLKAWGNNWGNQAPKTLVSMLSSNYPKKELDEIVLLLRVLAADVNQGYHGEGYRIIETVNGRKIRNLGELVHIVEKESADTFVIFTDQIGKQFVLDRTVVRETHEKILETYHVPTDRSADLISPPLPPQGGERKPKFKEAIPHE